MGRRSGFQVIDWEAWERPSISASSWNSLIFVSFRFTDLSLVDKIDIAKKMGMKQGEVMDDLAELDRMAAHFWRRLASFYTIRMWCVCQFDNLYVEFCLENYFNSMTYRKVSLCSKMSSEYTYVKMMKIIYFASGALKSCNKEKSFFTICGCFERQS